MRKGEEMAEFKVYRMWYQLAHVVTNGGSTGEVASQWKPSEHTFKGRTQEEAQNKANRLWRDAELGAGSMICVLEGSRP